ncbi:hypothetical protein BRADI_1g23513v3 [Brachypodium distachyon]|uniref:Uncharacterized protein n=1 Tax=Brachypodium distachyon TaxID=15368 RepID=A0A2K2DKR8_BRADI|nr:hypothetical protein BRADI_1g23513v3 [Brachypodium distachyon]PNT74873.1 hypothetical protein BRADI_1g23513v3 [Brachypodium distachyon]
MSLHEMTLLTERVDFNGRSVYEIFISLGKWSKGFELPDAKCLLLQHYSHMTFHSSYCCLNPRAFTRQLKFDLVVAIAVDIEQQHLHKASGTDANRTLSKCSVAMKLASCRRITDFRSTSGSGVPAVRSLSCARWLILWPTCSVDSVHRFRLLELNTSLSYFSHDFVRFRSTSGAHAVCSLSQDACARRLVVRSTCL